MYIECLEKNEDGICTLLDKLTGKEREEHEWKMRDYGEIPLSPAFSCNNCYYKHSKYTDYDWDKQLLIEYNKLKKKKENPEYVPGLMFCYGHRASEEWELEAIQYIACEIYLLMFNHARLLNTTEFCSAVKHAKRIGLKVPKRYMRRFKRFARRYKFGSPIYAEINREKLRRMSQDEIIELQRMWRAGLI